MLKLFVLILFCVSANFAFAQKSVKSLSVKELGEQFLKGKRKASDDAATMKILDSLLSKSADTRELCFKVTTRFAKTNNASLSEAISEYWLDYIKKYPKEFLKLFSDLKESEKKMWIGRIADELVIDSEGTNETTDAKKELLKIRKSCKDCDTEDLKMFDDFTKKVLKNIN